MSAVPTSPPLSSPAPVAARRHAPEREAAGEAPAFSLPADAPADSQSGSGADKGENPASANPGEASPSLVAEPGMVGQKPALPGAPRSQAAPVPPPAIVNNEAPAPAPTLPKPDVGVLVAIAEAQGPVVAADGGTAAPAETTEGKDKSEFQTATAEGAVALPLAMPHENAAVMVALTPAPAGAAAAAQGPASGGSMIASAGPAQAPPTSPATGSQIATPAETAPAEGAPGPSSGLPGAATGAIVASAPPAPGMQGEQSAPLATAGPTLEALASALKIADAQGVDAAKAASTTEESAGAKGADAGATGPSSIAPGAAAETSHSAAEGASSSDAGRTSDSAQPAATVEPGTLMHQRSGRPEAPVAGAEPSAPSQQTSMADRQGTADGAPTPLHVVPVEIGLRALAGSKRFDIRLDPAELGRVDVNLEISDKGEVSARLVVDRVETLHLLQRDARTLERAFEQAGLKPSDAGVDIMLRDQSDQSGFRQQRQDEQASHRQRPVPELGPDEGATAVQPVPVRRLVRLGGVDLSI